jgi:hypothetical protein
MRKSAIAAAVIICFILVLGPLNILRKFVFPEGRNEASSDVTRNADEAWDVNNQRFHLHTSNTIRVGVSDEEEAGIAISKILYPGGQSGSRAKGYILISARDWREVLGTIPLAKAYESPVIPVKNTAAEEIIKHIVAEAPEGIKQLGNSQVLVIGKGLEGLNTRLKENKISTRFMAYANLDDLQRQIYNLPGALKDKQPAFIVSDSQPLMSIPVATLLAQQGAILMYADKNSKLYKSSREIIEEAKLKKVYITGNRGLSAKKFREALDIEVVRIAGANPEETAVKIAKFYDSSEGLGWNANRNRNDSGHNFILCSKEQPVLAITASQLALKGKVGPLLWTERGRLSPRIENYLWRMQPNFGVTASEGPFNNVWVIGDNDTLDYRIQARADFTQEIRPYETLGEQAVSGLDVLSIVWMLFSFFGAIWVGLHAFYRMSKLFILTKLMWILSVILLGPVGIWLYIISYNNSPFMEVKSSVFWMRPLWKQSAVATVMTSAFGASVIIVMAYALSYVGLPLAPSSAPAGLHLLGSPMARKIIIAYIIAFVLNAYLFMPTIEVRMQYIPYRAAVRKSIPNVFISLTALSIGMVLALWKLNMAYTPIQPRADNILWWGFMQFSVLIGVLTAYIPNWWLVRYGKKLGTI